MNILNTCDRIMSCFVDGRLSLDAWRRYAHTISPHLVTLCEQDSQMYDMTNDIAPVVNAVAARPSAVGELTRSFDGVTGALQNTLGTLFTQGEPDVSLILYLGLCNGAGWATSLDGHNVVLLGIEKIIELGWQDARHLKGLITHELGHIWHAQNGVMDPPTQTRGDEGLVQLYQEGVAMVCEQTLCQDPTFFHQDRDGWLVWCQTHEAMITQAMRTRLEANASVQDFFGDWCAYQGQPDVGYYLGAIFIRFIMTHHPLETIAAMDVRTLWRWFLAFSDDTRTSPLS